MKIQITCIVKSDRMNPHERITYVGGIGWIETQQEAIRAIESGLKSYYVHAAGRTVDVVVAISHYGHKYLKTVADGIEPDNLLALGTCRVA